jgi:hypothetical protein
LQAFYPNNREVASYWNTAMGWDALLDATERNIKSEQPYYTQLNHDFYSMMDHIGWKRDYIDDMNWMALALLRAYNIFKDDKFLKKGVELYGEISRQWDETCCCKQNSTKPCVNGGIFWIHPTHKKQQPQMQDQLYWELDCTKSHETQRTVVLQQKCTSIGGQTWSTKTRTKYVITLKPTQERNVGGSSRTTKG